MRKFEITEEQIKKLAKMENLYELTLRSWFPEAFESEWEEIPLRRFVLAHTVRPDQKQTVFLRDQNDALPILLTINPQSGWRDDYKIEDGKIWGRKSCL